MTLTFGSLFSGIGGFDLGFERAGMRCAWQCEIDKAASGVLARRWPGIPNIGDVRDVRANNVEPVDLICGGFPCQDLSVAGKRAGLAGERSGLWFEYHRVLSELRPQWVVIENVPGLLSSNRGGDFAVILRGLADIGYLSAWRVLDAQYFGVAQRRRRVFVVASLGDGRAAKVLFEREGCDRDTPPRREAGEGTTAHTVPSLTASGRGTGRTGESRGQDPVIPVVGAVSSKWAKGTGGPAGDEVQNLVAAYHDSGPGWWTDGMGTLRAEGENRPSRPSNILAFTPRASAGRSMGVGEVCPTIESANNGAPALANTFGVRRLTPTECERLQGFPDGWTDEQADSARYRQLGNAVCVNVAEWIGRRIADARP